MPFRTNKAAHVEITAFAAGAGPPAKRIATRRYFRSEFEVVVISKHQQERHCPLRGGDGIDRAAPETTQGQAGKKQISNPNIKPFKDAALSRQPNMYPTRRLLPAKGLASK
jgi:hypothetical protein